MRKMKIKKFFLTTLCIGVLGCLAGGIYVQDRSMPIGARAEIAAGDFYIYSAGIRLVNDKNGTGLRFQTRINKTTYDELQSANSVSKTGTLILPEILYNNNLTLDNTSALNIDTTDLWTLTEDKTELYSIAYVYDIPASNYGSKLLAASYVAYTDGTVEYTAISPATSMMDVAKTAPAEKAEQVAPYLVENVTVKYKNVDGSLLSTVTHKYGETLTPPDVSVPDGYKFKGWCMKNGTAWDFEKWTAQGNVSLTATFEKYQGKYVIADAAYETGVDLGGGSQLAATTEISSAKGFDNVYKYQSTQANIHGMNYSGADLTKYGKVFFAVKTASFNLNGTVKDVNDWMYFALTQTSTATWDLSVTCNGATIYEISGLNGAYNSAANPAYSNNALDAILYGNPSGFYPMAVDGDLTVYVSEVRGVPGEGFTITQDAVLDGSAFTGTTVDTSVAAPEGYTTVSTRTNFRGSSGDGTNLAVNTYSRADMSAYSEVSFKTLTKENYYVIAGDWKQDVSGWVEWKFVKNSTGWKLTVTDSQSNVWLTKDLTGTSLLTLLGASDAEAASGAGIYVNAGGGQQVWVTELLGKVEANYDGVEVATDKILTDSTLTAETAPAGYGKVYTMTPKTTVSSGGGTELATVSGLDISKYVKLTYQIKVSDSWVLYNGWGHYYEANNTWQEVTVSKTASGWSVTFGGKTTEKTGNKLSDILAFEMDARKHTDCNPSVIHITELKGYVDLSYTEELPEMTPVEGVKIAESVYETGVDLGGGSQLAATTEIAPAKGFENVYKYQSSTQGDIHGKNYSGADLTKYGKVFFAVKTAKFNFNNEATQEFSDWAYFTLTQTSTATWNLSVTYNGAIVYTKAGLNGAYTTNENYTNNALDAILYGNPSGFYPMSVNGDLTVYVSELRGELAPIEYWGEKIVNSAVTDAVNAISEKETANGFEKVYKLSGAFGQGVFADVDITAYEEVRFYLTMNQALLLDDWSAYAYPNEGWTLVTLQNNLDGTNNWTVTLADRDDPSGANSFTATYTGTTLQQVLNAWYTTYDDNVLYVTDVRGIKAPAWAEKVVDGATIVGATQTSELQAPAGYEKLYLSNALSTSAGGNSFADVDISAYGEVRFKLKSNSYILWNGWNSIVLLKDNWMEFCLTQNADGTWNLFVDYGGGSYGGATKYEESGLAGTTLKAVLGKYEGSKQSEELVQRIYVTELRGEKKKSLTPF